MCVFFFKQKTAYEMRISDWSSDVCSSDLARRAIRLDEVMYRYSHRFGKGACLAPERGTDTTTPCPAVLAGSCSARTTIGIAIPSHLASLGLLARPGELYGGPIAIYRMLAICERFAWCRCLKLRQSAFTAQIDRHIVREEIDRDDAVVLAAIGVARLDRWRQHHLHVLGRIILRPIVAGVLSAPR